MPTYHRNGSIPITFGHLQFPNKRVAIGHFSAMLARYPEEGRVTAPSDIRDLTELLRRHPAAREKIGSGIDHFFVHRWYMEEQRTYSIGFWIARTDGTRIDFSFGKVINLYGKRNA